MKNFPFILLVLHCNMADIFQEEFSTVEDYTEGEDLVFLTKDSSEHNDEEKEEEIYAEDDNQDFVNVVVESTDPVEPQHIEPSLAELANSDFIHNRQLAARKILDFISEARSIKDELLSVISIMCKLADDEEPMVRAELMEQIPSIASFCREQGPDLEKIIRQQLVPITVKMVTDEQVQVRKVGQAFLLVLLERKLISSSQLSEWLCPLIAQFATSMSNTQDQTVKRSEAIDVMCKMAPLVGQDLTIKFFLEPFSSLCSDDNFVLREVCLVNFGDFCKVVGIEATESILLPKFLTLCTDEIYTLRKRCVEAFVDVSSVISHESRSVLANYYINLLDDSSDWKLGPVKISALQCLGNFITTFANPEKTGLCYLSGVLMPVEKDTAHEPNSPYPTTEKHEPEHAPVPNFSDNYESTFICSANSQKSHTNSNVRTDGEESISCDASKRLHSMNEAELHYSTLMSNVHLENVGANENVESSDVHRSLAEDLESSDDFRTSRIELNTDESRQWDKRKDVSSNTTTLNSNESYLNDADKSGVDLCINNENVFNNFQFWRTPLPEFSNLRIDDSKETNSHLHSGPDLNNLSPEGEYKSVNNSQAKIEEKVEKLKTNERNNMLTDFFEIAYQEEHYINSENLSDDSKISIYDQDIVPPLLLEKYLAMIDSIQNSSMKAGVELSQYCAFSLPGVAYTLGRKFWPYLKGICVYLTSHMQWRVRKTVAAYLHELSVIIGPEYTAMDLLPLFFSLLNDLDEVRYSLLAHLSDFLQNLKPFERNMFLPVVEELLKMDNENNWRFRYTLAQQMSSTVVLYEPSDVHKYLYPVGTLLIRDRISEVRHEAIRFVAVIVKHLVDKNGLTFAKQILLDIKKTFREATKWHWRQTYAFLCEEMAIYESFPKSLYAEKVLPSLLSLTWDTVPNVRLVVSRCLTQTLAPMGYLTYVALADLDMFAKVTFSLRNDVDRDVRYFACLTQSLKDL